MLEKGQSLSHYRLIEKIGEGGMGVVWRAEDTVLDRTVAIKLLAPDVSRNEQRRKLFLDEARSASAINDPHIIHVYEFGQEQGLDFIVMEYVEGIPLNKVLQGRPLPVEKVAALGEQMARALARAHQAGLVHRDLKPSNVLVTPHGEVKILDFGLAVLLEEALEDTATVSLTAHSMRPSTRPSDRTVVGTLPYMSPEQVRGEKLDGRSDIFSVGCVLYEMVTGQRPFSGLSRADTANAILRSRPRPPHALTPRLPMELDRIVQKALARRRVFRYQTMEDLAVDLKRLGRELESGSSPSYEDLGGAIGPVRRRTLVLAVGIVAAVALIGGGSWLLRSLVFTKGLDQRAILILPFEARGATSAQVGEAFAEAIAVDLAQADDLRVLPVLRAESGRPIDPLTEGRAAGAGRVLHGWLERADSHTQAGVQLVDVSENRILWGTTYDERGHQLSTLSSELARTVAEALGTALGTDYDFPLYLFGDPEMVASKDAAAAIEGWRRAGSTSALEPTERLVASFPTEISARAMQAYFLDQSARWNELEALIAAMERIDPKNPYADFFRAKLLLNNGQVEEMRETIGKVLTRQDLKPGLRAWLLRSRANWTMLAENWPLDLRTETPHEHSTELADLRAAIRLDPASAWSYLYLARALHHSGHVEEAVGYARRAAALEPAFSICHARTGQLLMALGRWAEAVEPLERACEIGSAVSCALRPVSLEHAGRDEEARTVAEELSTRSPQGRFAYHLSRYWALAGQRRRAIELLRKCVEEDGLADVRVLREAEFSGLHGEPEFDAILAKVRNRIGGE